MTSSITLQQVDALRPSRLNPAGWCMYCVERHCNSARCILLHANSVWEVCNSCDGSEYTDYATLERCTTCYSGVIEADANPVAEVIELAAVPSLRVCESWPADGGVPARWIEPSTDRLAGLRAHGVIA